MNTHVCGKRDCNASLSAAKQTQFVRAVLALRPMFWSEDPWLTYRPFIVWSLKHIQDTFQAAQWIVDRMNITNDLPSWYTARYHANIRMPRIYWDGVVWRFSATGVEAAKKKHSHFGWRHAGKTNFILRYGQSPHINRYIIHPQREIRLIVRFDRGELDCNSQYYCFTNI
jgi:hypothetical protein